MYRLVSLIILFTPLYCFSVLPSYTAKVYPLKCYDLFRAHLPSGTNQGLPELEVGDFVSSKDFVYANYQIIHNRGEVNRDVSVVVPYSEALDNKKIEIRGNSILWRERQSIDPYRLRKIYQVLITESVQKQLTNKHGHAVTLHGQVVIAQRGRIKNGIWHEEPELIQFHFGEAFQPNAHLKLMLNGRDQKDSQKHLDNKLSAEESEIDDAEI
jgi:hypothetical protein